MRSATPDQLKAPSRERNIDLAADFGGDARGCRDAAPAPSRRTSGRCVRSAATRTRALPENPPAARSAAVPISMRSRAGSDERPSAKRLREIADRGVDDGAALGRAGREIDRIERRQPQDVFGVDRIRIAQPVFDVGDRKALRPRRARRLRRGLRRRRHLRRPVEGARPRQIRFAALERRLPPFLAGDGSEPLDEARRHCRRAGKLGGVTEDHLLCAEQAARNRARSGRRAAPADRARDRAASAG